MDQYNIPLIYDPPTLHAPKTNLAITKSNFLSDVFRTKLQARYYSFVYVKNTIATNHNNYICINFQKITHVNCPQMQVRTKTRPVYCTKVRNALIKKIIFDMNQKQ